MDFVLADWDTLTMDGLTLLQAVRANPALHHLPVLLMTENTGIHTISLAMPAGADGCLHKPLLNEVVFKETVNKTLTQRGLLPA